VDPASDRRLGRAALIITALLIVTVAVTAGIATHPRGEIEIPAAWRSQADYTLIVFGRESCPACAASAKFNKELAAAAEARGVRVVAASTGSAEDPKSFAASIGVAPDHALRASPAPKRLHSVPAIVIVNRDGTILRKTDGVQSIAQQRALLDFVAALR
jgi:peroxiredoxin